MSTVELILVVLLSLILALGVSFYESKNRQDGILSLSSFVIRASLILIVLLIMKPENALLISIVLAFCDPKFILIVAKDLTRSWKQSNFGEQSLDKSNSRRKEKRQENIDNEK